MVRKPQAAGYEDHILKHLNSTHSTDKLVHRPARILVPDTGKQDRLRDQRRPVLPRTAQSNTGGHLMPRIRSDRFGILQRRNAAMEPSRCCHLPDPRRIFRFHEIRERKKTKKSCRVYHYSRHEPFKTLFIY